MIIELPDHLAEALLAIAERITAARAVEVMGSDDPAAPAVDGWISEAQAAELAGITASGMAKHRKRGTSPAHATFYGRPHYRKSNVLKWIEARERAGLVRRAGLGCLDPEGGEA